MNYLEDKYAAERKIIHMDMDCFYAAVEILERPELKNKPVVIGGSPESRSVVCTANYPARKFGVRSAMPSFQAYKLCPEAIFISPSFAKYKKVSEQIHGILRRYTDCIEPLSLDEAYLDVTNNSLGLYATQIAKRIKFEVAKELKLSCSLGVSCNKMLAKIASDWNKPSGIKVILPEEAAYFMRPLALRKIPGIGPSSEEKLKRLGYKVCADVQDKSKDTLIQLLGERFGAWIYARAFGKDSRKLETSRVRKSIGHEDTFSYDLLDPDEINSALESIINALVTQLQKKKHRGRTITLKVTYHDFEKITRSMTVEHPVADFDSINHCALKLLEKTQAGHKKIRLLGVSLSSLGEEEKKQNMLFNDEKLFH